MPVKIKVDGKSLVSRIGRVIKSIADPTGRTIAEDLLAALKANTPVDTGYARSRWTLSDAEPYNVKYKVGYTGLVGEFVYTISNDAPYMVYLNRGWSKQAPPFFIESTILSYGFSVDSV
jgi:hypothetical protein